MKQTSSNREPCVACTRDKQRVPHNLVHTCGKARVGKPFMPGLHSQVKNKVSYGKNIL